MKVLVWIDHGEIKVINTKSEKYPEIIRKALNLVRDELKEIYYGDIHDYASLQKFFEYGTVDWEAFERFEFINVI